MKYLPCPFCAAQPDFPDGRGTQFEVSCSDCGRVYISIQISDLMTMEERQNDPFTNYWYRDEYIERAREEATKLWNERYFEKSSPQVEKVLQAMDAVIVSCNKKIKNYKKKMKKFGRTKEELRSIKSMIREIKMK